MPITAKPQIANLDRVRPDIADQRRSHQKTVAIEFNAASIVVVVKASLDRVTLANEILPEDVCDVNILMARVEAIQSAVGVLLQHREVCGVELVAIVVERAKPARTEIIVGKNKPAEVGNKRLNTGAYRNEIVVGVEVRQLHFTKRFFERSVPVSAVRAPAHVDVDHAILACIEIIRNTERRRELNGPIARFESRIAVKQLKTELQCLSRSELLRTTKELAAYGIDGADVRWCWRAPLFHAGCTHGSENHEQLVAFDRIVAFENVLVIWIPPAASLEGDIATSCAAIAVTIVFGKDDAPPVRSFTALRRRRLGGRSRRNGNIDDDFFVRLDNDVFKRIAVHDREVAVVFIFVEDRDMRLV